MTIKELTGLAKNRCDWRSMEETAVALLQLLNGKTSLGGKTVFVDTYVSEAVREAFQKACEIYHCVLRTQDYALFGKAENVVAFVVSYPNSEGNVEDYGDFIEDLQEKGIVVAMECDYAALHLLKSPGSMGVDFAFGCLGDACFLAVKNEYALPENDAKILALEMDKETAARIHGMTAYLNDALEVYGYEQENNAFFNTLKIQLPDSISDEDFKALAADYELDYQALDNHFVLVSLTAKDDSDSLAAIIDCLAEAGDNFGTPVDEEDWTGICALDGSLLR